MSTNIPILPVAGGTLLRALASVLAVLTYWLKQFARVRRHRRDAAMLAGLDRRMLSDIGISRSDLRDAFSAPFWNDPTELLHERALERRVNRPAVRIQSRPRVEPEPSFRRPATDRPARQAI